MRRYVPEQTRNWLVGIATALALSPYSFVSSHTSDVPPTAIGLEAQVLDPEVAHLVALVQPGAQAVHAVARDLDHDGDRDLVTSTTEEPIVVWINDGNGHFHRQPVVGGPLLGGRPGRVEPASCIDIQAVLPKRNRGSALCNERPVLGSATFSLRARLIRSRLVLPVVLANRPARGPPHLHA
jgi:hypothetical protein